MPSCFCQKVKPCLRKTLAFGVNNCLGFPSFSCNALLFYARSSRLPAAHFPQIRAHTHLAQDLRLLKCAIMVLIATHEASGI
jgi:hypothetical protein